MAAAYRDVLRVKPFRDLWAGQTVSQLGDSLYYLVFLYMVDRLTGDPRVVGLTGAAQALPFLLLSPYAGVLADRMDRRRILVGANVLSALALAAFAVFIGRVPAPPAWCLIGMGALLSVINVFFTPAKGAAIPQVVPPEMLVTANALSMATQNLVPMLGVALSGVQFALLDRIDARYSFLGSILLNALSFAVAAGVVARLPRLLPEDADHGAAPRMGVVARAMGDVRAGFRYIRGHRVLLVQLVVNLLVQLAIAPFMLVYVRVNREWFGGSFAPLAVCEVSFFVGVVLCSLFVQRLAIRRAGAAFVWGMAGVGATVAMMAVSHTVALFAFWNFMAGLAFPFAQLPITTYVQRSVPERFQGRVNAAQAMTGFGVQPLGIALGGLVIAKVGPAWTLAGMGISMALASLVGLLDGAFRAASLDD